MTVIKSKEIVFYVPVLCFLKKNILQIHKYGIKTAKLTDVSPLKETVAWMPNYNPYF